MSKNIYFFLTTTLLPSTDRITTLTFLSIKLPSLTAKTLSLFTTIHPDGCKSVSVWAISPTNFSHPKLAAYPSSYF